jgi:hypothetical protein
MTQRVDKILFLNMMHNLQYGYEMVKNSMSYTFRINQDTADKLNAESEHKGISLNNLVNQILKNYIDWDRLESKVGMIPVAKPVIAEVFTKLSDDDVIKLATFVGKSTLHDIVLFMKNKIDLDSLLSWLELWLKKNSTAGFSHNVENNIHTCTMKHDLGQKWSLYHKTVLELILRDVLKKHIEIIVSDKILTFKFEDDGR